jgi:hypothetical protein
MGRIGRRRDFETGHPPLPSPSVRSAVRADFRPAGSAAAAAFALIAGILPGHADHRLGRGEMAGPEFEKARVDAGDPRTARPASQRRAGSLLNEAII